MDPRHPEQAISRMRDLMEQYNRIEQDMLKSASSAELAELEREGSLVIQEICLVAPRIHEAMMQTSRQRRYDLAHGVVITMSKYKVPAGATGEEEGVVEKPVEYPRTAEFDKNTEDEPELTFEQQAIKYTLELDAEIEAREKNEKKSRETTVETVEKAPAEEQPKTEVKTKKSTKKTAKKPKKTVKKKAE